MILRTIGREGEAFATYGIDEWKIRNCKGRTIRENLQYGRCISPFINAGGVAAAVSAKSGNIQCGSVY